MYIISERGKAMKTDYSEIIKIHSEMVYRIAFAGTANAADAEDITQDVFVKLLKYRKKFESEEHCKAWLIRVTLNEVKLLKRSAWFRKRDSNTEINEIHSDNDICIQAENMLVYDAVMKLKHDQRIAVILFYFYDYSCGEIAEMSGTKESTVRTRLKRARENLRTTLKERIL